ncbi:MAG: peptidoglycan-binding protein [Alphaproteobacteria bacterium]|nr:MAG: peptidoglycan-binding protein [Alphaproteobacteria bacterium]
MKRTLTAVIALAAAAGFSAAPGNPDMAPRTAAPAPQASTQRPAGTSEFWSRNISQDEVRQAQQQLKTQGLYNGPIDGMAGPEMQRALARYQQQNGLRQTATLDEPTMGRLGGGMSPATGVTAPPAGSSPTVGAATPPAGSRPAAGATTPPAGSTTATAGTTAPPAGSAAPAGAGGTTSSAPATTTTTQPMTR